MLLLALFLLWLPDCVYAREPVVIVLDPGHGGDNSGASFDGRKEKDVTLKLALALKANLERYPNVRVWLTRTEDSSMSLRQRAEFAKEEGADILISLHLNASVNHEQFGGEVWVSAFPSYYQKGYMAGYYLLQEWSRLGLANRGIKTRLDENLMDYYGIIRNARELEIPAIIAEHCYMDNEKDTLYYKTEEGIMELAKADCEALVQCFSLDNKVREPIPIPEIGEMKYPAIAPPQWVELKAIPDKKGKKIQLEMEVSDTAETVTYFDYSTDSGATWSSLEIWKGKNKNTAVIEWDGSEKEILVRVYNGYNRGTQSNQVRVKKQNQAAWVVAVLSFAMMMIWSGVFLFLFLLCRSHRKQVKH